MLEQLWIAVAGGIAVLLTQALAVIWWRWRKRHLSGEVPVGTVYAAARRFLLFGRKRAILRALRRAAETQRSRIELQYAQDPLWRLGQIRLIPARADGSMEGTRLTLEQAALAAEPGRPVFVRGIPGSGKSSASSLAAATWASSRLALRFDLATYYADRPLLEQCCEDTPKLRQLEMGLALNEVALLFDGFESLTADEDRLSFDAEVERLTRRFPKVRIVVLSRPDSAPTRIMMRAQTYQIAPLTLDDIESAIRRASGTDLSLLDQLDDRVKEVCSSPLALRMLLRTYSETGSIPRNSASLYHDFVEALLAGDAETSAIGTAISPAAKLEVLGDLAFLNGNRVASLDIPTALGLLAPSMTELQSQYIVPANVQPGDMLRSLVANGLLRSDGRTIRFVHFSVQEYLSAVNILQRLEANELSFEALVELATHSEWRNSIVFLSGLLADSTALVRDLRLKNRTLAAECIRSANVVAPALVDRCIVEALYEFKFGTTSFNYELVFALALIADRRSADLPPRIIAEMQYWCTKYATRPLIELSGVDDSVLITVLGSDEFTPQMSDAIWTLGVRQYAPAVPLLEGFLRERAAPLDNVSALALGRMKSRRSAQLLLSTAFDASAPDPLRSACYNSLGMIGAKECLPAIFDFLQRQDELDGAVRENAGWALVGLTDDILAQTKEFQDLLIAQLNIGRPYSRAMFAYLIGRFKIRAGLQELIHLATNSSTDSLLMEDVVFAIGEFKDRATIPVLKSLLAHPDNVVRARVIEAYGRVGGDRAVIARLAGADEPSDIVRDAAKLALGELSPGAPSLAADIALDVRRRR